MKRKDEGRRMKDEGGLNSKSEYRSPRAGMKEVRNSNFEFRASLGFRISAFRFFLFSSFILHPSSFLFATPTQQQVLQSIKENVGQSVDETSLLGFLLAVAAMVLLLVVLGHRRGRAAEPKEVNHPGKLLKEISRSIHLRPAEVRQLKILAEGQNISSPLVLMLCPSLMAKAVKENAERIDRRVVAGLAQKIAPARNASRSSESKSAPV